MAEDPDADEPEPLVAAFVDEWLAGGHRSLDEWIERHPQLADWARRHRGELESVLAFVGRTSADPPDSGDAAVAPLPALPGFELVRELGRGSSAAVYEARDQTLGRTVALKLYHRGALGTAAAMTRFLAEARAAARLNHPNVVAIHSVGEHQGQPFLCLEYVAGRTLADLLADLLPEREPLPIDRALSITRDLARALHAIHGAGLLHRDVKPSNVMLDRAGHAKLMDFGLASGDHVVGAAADGPPLSITGTPRYMSPEQAAGQPLDVRSDLFALGIVLYETIAGVPPFTADSVETLRRAVRDEEPAPLLAHRSDVPPACSCSQPSRRSGRGFTAHRTGASSSSWHPTIRARNRPA